MAFERTSGFTRASGVQITRTVNGDTDTFDVSMLTAIPYTEYQDITVAEFERLSRANYEARRDAFVTYIESQYEGLDINTDGSIAADPNGIYYI